MVAPQEDYLQSSELGEWFDFRPKAVPQLHVCFILAYHQLQVLQPVPSACQQPFCEGGSAREGKDLQCWCPARVTHNIAIHPQPALCGLQARLGTNNG